MKRQRVSEDSWQCHRRKECRGMSSVIKWTSRGAFCSEARYTSQMVLQQASVVLELVVRRAMVKAIGAPGDGSVGALCTGAVAVPYHTVGESAKKCLWCTNLHSIEVKESLDPARLILWETRSSQLQQLDISWYSKKQQKNRCFGADISKHVCLLTSVHNNCSNLY